MKTVQNSRLLGWAFSFQAFMALAAGVSFGYLTDEGPIDQILARLSHAQLFMRWVVLGDALTALGIIFLGVVLYAYLHPYGKLRARMALSIYLVEAALLFVHKILAFFLWQLTQTQTGEIPSPELLALGGALVGTMKLTYSLHMLAFCSGALLFYSLLIKSPILPKWASWWGFLTVFPMITATVVAILGVSVPFAVYLPYLPFEFVVGVWLLIKGVPQEMEG